MPTPELLARQQIDRLLIASGWTIQDRGGMNLYAAQGMAVRDFLVQGSVEAGQRLRHILPEGEAALCAFEGKMEEIEAGCHLSIRLFERKSQWTRKNT